MCVIKKYGLCFSLFFLCFGGIAFSVYGQEKDTLLTKSLNDVIVREKRTVSNKTSVSQSMDSAHLQQLPTIQLSDALKFFSGVQVKDFGGVGGLKTISVRSLGANHTAVAYDGISVSDCQTGQINLGRFSLENMETVHLNVDNGMDIFLPARLSASANVLQLFTLKPHFTDKKPYNVKVSFRGGSYTLLQPFLLVENQISKHLVSSFMFDYIYQKGDYPFQIQNGDSTLTLKRTNADIQMYRIEENLYLPINDKQELTAKVFYYHSEQNLPGAVIFYTVSPSQQLWDQSVFAQVHYLYKIHKKIHFQSNAKWNYASLRYVDSLYMNAEGELDNRYIQREIYLSNAALYMPFTHWSFSISNDLSYNRMSASVEDFVNPLRYSSLTAFSSLFSSKKVQVSACVLHTYMYDLSQKSSFTKSTDKWTPSFRIAYKPFDKEDFYIKAFYKHIFRMPTFNDMYYRLVGNVHLLPENAYQCDAGFSYARYINNCIPYVSVAADVYYNYVKDKIIAMPNKNLFIWSMINLGEVSITGVDAQAAITWKINKKVSFETTLHYTYQQAIDITDKTAKNYKNQIPYTPKHTASTVIACENKWIHVSYSLMYVGERYSLGQNIPDNVLEAYFDHSFAFYRSFKLKKTTLSLRAEVLNVFNAHYEVVKNYPMAGRQFQGKITYNF